MSPAWPHQCCPCQNAPRGISVFHLPCLTERSWTKRELSDALNATDAMLDSVQIYGGMIALRKVMAAAAPSPAHSCPALWVQAERCKQIHVANHPYLPIHTHRRAHSSCS